jgi:16S rRNA (guanine966-N2)-methyltransferase
MAKARRRRPPPSTEPETRRGELRIIGGRMRGRKLRYSGRFETRPMKERVREAIFNLVGPSIKGTHAIDLFAGTGALGLEALSRGAVSATFIERHVPTAKLIGDNARELGVADRCDVTAANTCIWVRQGRELPQTPWCVFCSPPYDFYVERQEEMLTLIERLIDQAPPGSIVVVEADRRFDFAALPQADDWNVRAYPPAVVGILRK